MGVVTVHALHMPGRVQQVFPRLMDFAVENGVDADLAQLPEEVLAGHIGAMATQAA
jgi:hypothetical protein